MCIEHGRTSCVHNNSTKINKTLRGAHTVHTNFLFNYNMNFVSGFFSLSISPNFSSSYFIHGKRQSCPCFMHNIYYIISWREAGLVNIQQIQTIQYTTCAPLRQLWWFWHDVMWSIAGARLLMSSYPTDLLLHCLQFSFFFVVAKTILH